MTPLSLRDLPLVETWSFKLRRLVSTQRLLVVVSDRRLVCCWQSRLGWVWRSAAWPEDCCRDGQPLQREVIGELLADLLLDEDLVGTQVELVLPMEVCQWRVLNGEDVDQLTMADPSLFCLDDLSWSFQSSACYVTLENCHDDALAIGVARLMLQAWCDVVDTADQPLRRVDWTLSTALRGLMLQLDNHNRQGDLAWLTPDPRGLRLVIIRDGVPEVDRCVPFGEPSTMRHELRRIVSAWQSLMPSRSGLAWWFSLPEAMVEMVLPTIDVDRNEMRLDVPLNELLRPALDKLPEDELTPLEQLTLVGMLEDIHP